MRTINFKTLLLLCGMVGLVGCSKPPERYYKAAERYSEALCKGVVDSVSYSMLFYDSVLKSDFNYVCITSNGTSQHHVPFAKIPVEYFKEVKNEPTN